MKHHRIFTIALLHAALLSATAAEIFAAPALSSHPAAAAMVNALDFNPTASDATTAIQAAIDTGAAQVLIPYTGSAWIVRPLFARRSDQEIILEPGVELLAKADSFHGEYDVLLTISNVTNVTIRGYGATIRMRRADYQNSALYTPSEHRHAINITTRQLDASNQENGPGYPTTNITVVGLQLIESGGDGICVWGQIGLFSRTAPLAPKNITIRDVVCDRNHRQGVSIISAEGLLMQDIVMQNTEGTPPQAGLDYEPDWQPLRGIVLRNSLIRNNKIKGLSLFLYRPVWKGGEDKSVSVLIDRCHIDSTPGSGQGIPGTVQRIPAVETGTIRWTDCVLRSRNLYSVMEVENKDYRGASVTFERCLFDLADARPAGTSPLLLTLSTYTDVGSGDGPVKAQFGGIAFTDCIVNDLADRPFIRFKPEVTGDFVRNITGNIVVNNAYGATQSLGVGALDCTLTSTSILSTPPTVTLTAPVHLTNVSQGTSLVATATADAPDSGTANGAGIQKVVFTVRRGSALIASATETTAPYTAAFPTSTWEEGLYIVRATTSGNPDSDGNQGINEDACTIQIVRPYQANLQVTALSCDANPPAVGVATMLRATISNLGNRSSSQAVASTIVIGGQTLALPNTGRILGAQESTVVTISWTPTHGGTLTLDAQVDPAKAETESNETDNHFSLPLTVNHGGTRDKGPK